MFRPRTYKQLKNNIRFQALNILAQVEHQGGFSHQLIQDFLNESTFKQVDNNLLVKLVYGTLKRQKTLDFYLAPYTKKIQPWVRSLLRMSAYQLIYLDRIPPHAIINEAVRIAKVNGHQGIGNMVNAILRNLRRHPLADIEGIEDPIERRAVKYSVEPWFITYFDTIYPPEKTDQILESVLEEAYLAVRINNDASNRQEMMTQMTDEGFEVEASPLSPYGIRILSGDLIHSDWFESGKVTIQDESSMLVAPLGALTGDEVVWDACSAPGGKATHMAQLLPEGTVYSTDISKDKIPVIEAHAERLNLLERMKIEVGDASTYEAASLLDVVYVDAPCSGLGLMRRKPEIKYVKNQDQINDLTDIQTNILNNASQQVTPGGLLIFSTCTLTIEENEKIIEKFLAQHSNFKRLPISSKEVPQEVLTELGDVRVTPDEFGTDGFYIARLQLETE